MQTVYLHYVTYGILTLFKSSNYIKGNVAVYKDLNLVNVTIKRFFLT